MKSTSRLACGLVLLFALVSGIDTPPSPPLRAEGTREGYFPKFTLRNQDNKEVSFYNDLVKDKIVIINMMYTRCDGKLCDQGTKNLVELQKALGDRLGREVFIYSITLDPDHDTPEVLKEYAATYGAKWTFLTGKIQDITELRRKLGLFDPDPKVDSDRTQHSGMVRIGNDSFNRWSATSVLSKPERILEMIQRTKPPGVIAPQLTAVESGTPKMANSAGATVTINGLRVPNRWEPKAPTVKVGDVVEWRTKEGTHGVIFSNWDVAKLVLEVDSASLEIKTQPGFPAPAQGTAAKAAPPDTLLVRAIVKAVPAGVAELPFVCTQHGEDMPGSLLLQASKKSVKSVAPTVTINGLIQPLRWDPKAPTVKVGDVVEWRAKEGTHGVIFSNWDVAKLVLDVDTAVSLEIKLQEGFPAPAQGTVAKGAPDTLLLRATVKAVPAGVAELPFVCTQHGEDMPGSLMLQTSGTPKKAMGSKGLGSDLESAITDMPPSVQRRMLRFVNRAYTPAELSKSPQEIRVTSEHAPLPQKHASAEVSGLSKSLANVMLSRRPLDGWKDVRECLKAYDLSNARDEASLDQFLRSLGPSQFGQWREVGTVAVQGGEEPVMHAALLHTGKVLMTPNNTKTVLWDPNAPAATSVEILPGATTGLTANLFCSGHSFLRDGRLLAVGGGGGGPGEPSSVEGWKFDPLTSKWSRTANNMAFKRWYPTLVTLGDERSRVLVASGWQEVGDDPAPKMEIYSEATDKFELVTATGPAGDLNFRPTYPGLHLLPKGEIMHVPTGFERCDQGPSGAIADPTAIFTFSGANTGSWRKLEANHRVKGMSLLLFNQASPFVQAMVVGGGDLGTSGTAQTMDLTTASPKWKDRFPLLESRVHPNAVVLPDGTVFICGGRETRPQPPPNGSRCELYNPQTNTIAEMDEMIRPRHYHSMAILLPTGEVMAAGGAQDGGCSVSVQNTIEVFSPPYLFRGPRPVITVAPAKVKHGDKFVVETPEAKRIARVILARPMAVTHQTDSGQRIIPLTFRVTGAGIVEVHAPGGPAPNHVAPPGHYMLFILNDDGVPSVAKWVLLG